MPSDAKRKPGAVGFIVGAALIVVGIVVGVILIVASAGGAMITVTSQPSFPTDQDAAQVTLTGGQTMGLWFSDSGRGNCAIQDPSGNDVNFVPISTTTTQTVNNYQLVATFQTTDTGEYSILCQSTGAPFQFKVASTLDVAKFGGGVVGGILLIFIGGIAGIVVMIVTGVRRSSWTRRNRSFTAVGGYNGAANYGPTGAQQQVYQPGAYSPGAPQPGYAPGQPIPPQQPPYSPPPPAQGTPTYQPPSFPGSSGQ
ncbi:MAG: hypothetical protein FWF25_07125 [Propionibacteriaceae bacterium]|nr:hypothetical protein [Propionibacteriaceae bacterium]